MYCFKAAQRLCRHTSCLSSSVRVRDFSVWPIRSEPFRSGPFRSGSFRSGSFRSGPFRSGPFRSGPFRSGLFRSVDISVWAVSVWEHFGQTMKSCRNLTCSHFNANILKSTRSFILKKYKHDPRSKVNRHQHMVFIIISKQMKSLSTFCNTQILQSHIYNSDLIAIMTPQRELV